MCWCIHWKSSEPNRDLFFLSIEKKRENPDACRNPFQTAPTHPTPRPQPLITNPALFPTRALLLSVLFRRAASMPPAFPSRDAPAFSAGVGVWRPEGLSACARAWKKTWREAREGAT